MTPASFTFLHAADLHLGSPLGGLALKDPLFDALGGVRPMKQRAPSGVLAGVADLPVTLKRFEGESGGRAAQKHQPPAIIFPPNGTRLAAAFATDGSRRPLVLKIQGGSAPFSFLINGKPLPQRARTRQAQWTPDGPGYSSVTVIDARGQSDTVTAYVE